MATVNRPFLWRDHLDPAFIGCMIDAVRHMTPHGVDDEHDFVAFVAEVEPRLRRALAGSVGVDRAHDAVAEALAWAWENWTEVEPMANPAGYLFRVARSHLRTRLPKRVRYLTTSQPAQPQFEPGLPAALASLPAKQRIVVWLVYACEWSYREVGEALDISPSAVGTHASRGLTALRNKIGDVHG